MRIFISLLILWGTVFSAGCQPNPADAGPPVIEPVSPILGEPQMTPSFPVPVDAGLQDLIDKAVADLANRLVIPAAQIIVLEVTPMVWPDASLGCPQPGMAYAQVPVDGLLIRLHAGEEIYEYHSGGVREPFLCVKTEKDPNTPRQIDIFNLTPSDPRSTPDTAPTPDNSIPPGEDQ